MTINTQRKIEIINKCNAIFNKKLLIEAIMWKNRYGTPIQKIKSIFLFGRYPGISIRKNKYHIHRLIMEYMFRGKVKNNHIDHINGNKLDCRLLNLRILNPSVHMSITNKGKKLTKEHRNKIAIANKNRKGIKMKLSVPIDLRKLKVMLRNEYL